MYVRKFEADSMDEVLKAIKFELGPEAIIIKTVTNSGIKGAFKKKKLEVTAAITEEEFKKKKKLDKILSEDQKSELYQKKSKDISKTIEQYTPNKEISQRNSNPVESGYGLMGMNKSVKAHSFVNAQSSVSNDRNYQATEMSHELNMIHDDHSGYTSTAANVDEALSLELEEFLSGERTKKNSPIAGEKSYSSAEDEMQNTANDFELKKFHQDRNQDRAQFQSSITHQDEVYELKKLLHQQERAIEKLQQEMKQVRSKTNSESDNQLIYAQQFNDYSDVLKQIFTTLKTFDLDNAALKLIMDEVRSHHPENMSEDDIWQIILQFIQAKIFHKKPRFINSEIPTVTLMISEGAAGQTSFLFKYASQVKRASITNYLQKDHSNKHENFTSKVTGVEIDYIQKLPDLIHKTKEKLESGIHVFIDYKIKSDDLAQLKSVLNTLRKSFTHVEVVLCLSAIHSDLYSKKLLNQLHREVDFISFSHTDLCLNWAVILNLHFQYHNIPLAHFSSGPIIPKDLVEVEPAYLIKQMFGL